MAASLNRKYAIGLLRHPPEAKVRVGRRREVTYSEATITALELIRAAADFPWPVRLQAMPPLWLPWARKRVEVTPEVEAELARISARTIDRRLQPRRVAARQRLYGRTKPGTVLKHQIPVRTERWAVDEPGWGEIDLVSHSGPCAEGECAHSLNFTDIHSTWVGTTSTVFDVSVPSHGEQGSHRWLQAVATAASSISTRLRNPSSYPYPAACLPHPTAHLIDAASKRSGQLSAPQPIPLYGNHHHRLPRPHGGPVPTRTAEPFNLNTLHCCGVR